jgi:histidinol dehydrogenase
VERLRLTESDVAGAVRRLRPSSERRDDVAASVADVVEMVRNGGDDAIRRLTLRLDGVDVADPRVPHRAIAAAVKGLAPAVRDALELLAGNVRAVARELMPKGTRVVLPQGQVVSSRPVPVRRAGIYVPGGLAAYPSSAVMAIVPAQVAGVPGIAVCSPPGPDGLPHATALAACGLLGVEEMYAIGGAQAVAALALGTERIPRVDLVVGPGNAYVEEAPAPASWSSSPTRPRRSSRSRGTCWPSSSTAPAHSRCSSRRTPTSSQALPLSCRPSRPRS